MFSIRSLISGGTALMLALGLWVLSAGWHAAPPPDAGAAPVTHLPLVTAAYIANQGHPERVALRSGSALVVDESEGVVLLGHNIGQQRAIASLTKLMTAVVTLDSGLALDEPVTIAREDRDRLRGTRSRLDVGAVLTRYDLLHAALAASDNRAAAALGRSFPGGVDAMVTAMNAKALELGMTHTRFADTSGLRAENVSTAVDLVRLVKAAGQHPLITAMTTSSDFRVIDQRNNTPIGFVNTNRLLRNGNWDIGLSKTGYTAAAGNCLVMRATISKRPVIIVLLNSWGKLSRYGDSERIRDWLINTEHALELQRRRQAPGLSA